MLMLLIAIAGTICAVGGSFFAAQIAIGFGRIMRGKIFSQVEHFSLAEFDTFSTASLITRTTNDTAQVQQFLIMGWGNLFPILRWQPSWAPSPESSAIRPRRRDDVSDAKRTSGDQTDRESPRPASPRPAQTGQRPGKRQGGKRRGRKQR